MNHLLTSTSVKFIQQQITGTVEETIAPSKPGRVKYDGTYWPARFYETDCQATVLPNEPVTIVAIAGITLLVVPGCSIE